jgi:hypothetical protein
MKVAMSGHNKKESFFNSDWRNVISTLYKREVYFLLSYKVIGIFQRKKGLKKILSDYFSSPRFLSHLIFYQSLFY